MQVNLIVNYDLPLDAEHRPDKKEFIHRVGRAGRVDRRGIAVAFTYDEKTREQVKAIFSSYDDDIDYAEVRKDDTEKLIRELEKIIDY